MKKYLSILLGVLFSTLFFASCSSDDDVDASSIIGKWYVVNAEVSSSYDDDAECDMVEGDWIEFKSDNTCSWTEYGYKLNASYKISGSTLSIYDIDDNGYMPFSYIIEEFDDNTLVLVIDLGALLKGRIEFEK